VYGKVASHAPAPHLRSLSAGDLFTTYKDSFTPAPCQTSKSIHRCGSA
jgi:hypothetical protein